MSGAELLRAVIDHPEDDARRLVYADWLQQRGDPQGELIAVQIQLARAPAGERGELQARAKALLDAHGGAWTTQLGDDIKDVVFRRGLAYAARAPVRAGTLDVLDRAPIRDLGLTALGEDSQRIARELAGDPRLERVELLATDGEWGGPALAALLASPHLGNLRGLHIGDRDCQVYAGHAIAAARLPRLELLAFAGDWRSDFGDPGVVALARAELPALRDLVLLNLGLASDAAVALATSPTLTRLSGLDLGYGSTRPNRIGARGAAALAGSENARQLRRLILDHNDIGGDGLAALAGSPHLDALRYLSLRHADITDAGLRALAAGDAMPRLELLELTLNGELTHAGIEALADSPRLATLSSLWLRQTPIGPGGARAIARSPHASSLRSLNLLECELGDEGARALLASPYLGGLTDLQVSGNQLSDDIRTALHARWGTAVRAER